MRAGSVPQPSFTAYGKVAVFQPRPGLGDLIWHLPVIRAVAQASEAGRVTLITKPSTQADSLLSGDPAIGRVVWFDRNPRQGRGRHDGPFGYPRLVAALRGCRADTCVLLHHGASLAAAMALAGIPHRYGYGFGAQRVWLNHGPFIGQDVRFTEAFDQAASFARAAGLWPLPEPSIALQPTWKHAARTRLAGMPRPIAALGIGSHGADRQWGAPRFAALADGLLQRGYGSILLLAGPQEGELALSVRRCVQLPSKTHMALGWELPEVAAVLAEADLFIGNDSGLMNLRAAVDRPAYGLFGASGPLRHSSQIRPIIPHAGPRAGMEAITVAQVLSCVFVQWAEARPTRDAP